ncbi:MAG TPA: cysteine hydrolase family protein [Povalibacter sp.]
MKSALLIIDVQQVLCVGAEAAFDVENVVDRINLVSQRMRAAALPVIFIQHEDDGPLKSGSAGWELHEKLVVQAGDIRVRKTASDAFHHTELQSALQSRGIDRLVACGLQSDFCVDSTVRRALALGYPVTLIADGHSTVDNGVLTAAQISAHHNTTLANLGSYGPRVKTIAAAEFRAEN